MALQKGGLSARKSKGSYDLAFQGKAIHIKVIFLGKPFFRLSKQSDL